MKMKCNPNFIVPNCPNSDSTTSHFAGVVRLILPFHRRFFHSVSCWEKANSTSHGLDDEAIRLLCRREQKNGKCNPKNSKLICGGKC